MFCVISYENGAVRYGDFNSYAECLDYADSYNGGHEYTVETYESESEYLENI